MTDSDLTMIIVLAILVLSAVPAFIIGVCVYSDEEYMENMRIKTFNAHRDKYIDSETLFYLLLQRSGHYYYDVVAETIDIEIPEGWDEDDIIDKYLSVRIFSKREFKHAYTRDVIWSGPFNNECIVALYMDMLPETEESLRDAKCVRQLYESVHPEALRNRLLQVQNDLLKAQGDRNTQQMEDFQKTLVAALCRGDKL